MALITPDLIQTTFKEMDIEVETDGKDHVYTATGSHAPVLHTVTTLDDDGGGLTVLTALTIEVPAEKRAAVCELLNLVHGQSLWNVRFHLDDSGRVFSVGKLMLWGRPFNAVQFGDIFFSLLVTTDRLFPCLVALTEEKETVEAAFERFFDKETSTAS